MDQVITVFEFNATDPGELSFKKGEILTVLDRNIDKLNLSKAVESFDRFHSRQYHCYNRSTVYSNKQENAEVVSQLVAHGCQDITARLELSSFAEYPVSHGGFSDIYRGQLKNGTWVAVKALRVSADSISQNPKHLKHAARELHTWGRCTHPNVVRLFGLAIFRDRIGMVAPWMAYGTLPRYLERMPGVDRLSMCVQICEGLSYLHQIRIIHCDLKGANVLVSDEGIPVLTDFGNSSLVDRTLGFTQTTSGPSFTVRWSAPEIIEETTCHTKASDVYALGMTVYETVTGMVPYQGKSETNVIRLVTVKKELPERPEVTLNNAEITDKLWKLLTECWSSEPTQRPNVAKVAKTMEVIIQNTQTRSEPQATPINDQTSTAEEVHSRATRGQQKVVEWLKTLGGEGETTKMRAVQVEHFVAAADKKRHHSTSNTTLKRNSTLTTSSETISSSTVSRPITFDSGDSSEEERRLREQWDRVTRKPETKALFVG